MYILIRMKKGSYKCMYIYTEERICIEVCVGKISINIYIYTNMCMYMCVYIKIRIYR